MADIKFIAAFGYLRSKLSSCSTFGSVVDTGGNLLSVSFTPGCKFATGVVDTGGAPDLQISPRILEKILNDPYVIFMGLGEDDF
jgi:hypothetical protein